jgi:hypothetical protein
MPKLQGGNQDRLRIGWDLGVLQLTTPHLMGKVTEPRGKVILQFTVVRTVSGLGLTLQTPSQTPCPRSPQVACLGVTGPSRDSTELGRVWK